MSSDEGGTWKGAGSHQSQADLNFRDIFPWPTDNFLRGIYFLC